MTSPLTSGSTNIFDPEGRLRFEEAEHRYWMTMGGTVTPLVSVTSAIRHTYQGLCGEDYWNEDAARRGTAVHRAIWLYEQNDLDVEGLHPVVRPFFEAYLKFKDSYKPTWYFTEQFVFDPRHRYAGGIDLLGRLGFDEKYQGLDIVDGKTGSIPWWIGLQLAGYRRCVRAAFPTMPIRSWVLHLRADATYVFKQIGVTDAMADETEFLGCVGVAWRRAMLTGQRI
jgi:hypothetical protein